MRFGRPRLCQTPDLHLHTNKSKRRASYTEYHRDHVAATRVGAFAQYFSLLLLITILDTPLRPLPLCHPQPSSRSASHLTSSAYHPHTTRKHICDGKRRVASLWTNTCSRSPWNGTQRRHFLSMFSRHLRSTACCCQPCQHLCQ
jgi:hypothetical protein